MMLLGESLLLGSWAMVLYTAAIWLTFHLFVTLYEEPDLQRRFGEQYERYCREVPPLATETALDPPVVHHHQRRTAASKRPTRPMGL